MSVLFCSLGIFLLLNFYTKKILISLFSALLFLSISATSYYYLSAGNHPYLFALFTIPLTIFFLEKSFLNKNYSYFYLLLFCIGLLAHIFIALCLLILVFLRLLLEYKLTKNIISKGFLFMGFPLIVCSFWLLPFLTKSSSFLGDESFMPTLAQLIGITPKLALGMGGATIGIAFFLFIFCLLFFNFLKRNKIWIFLFSSSVLFFALFMGILGKYYPTGIGAIRFVVPFSILMCIFIGFTLSNIKLRKFWIIAIFLLVGGLIINQNLISVNYERYSHASEDERLGVYSDSLRVSDFPVKNEITNSRFGSRNAVFSQSLALLFPKVSQTGGYYDQGILYPEILSAMYDAVWSDSPINNTLVYLDNFAIKYFELSKVYIGYSEKFENDNFTLVYEKNFSEAPFKIYEYKNFKPLISVLYYDNLSGDVISLNPLESSILRESPDEIRVNYNFTGKEAILVKEFYYPSWKAKDIDSGKSIAIAKNRYNFMLIVPENSAQRVLIYQSRTLSDNLGLIISFIGIILFILLNKKL